MRKIANYNWGDSRRRAAKSEDELADKLKVETPVEAASVMAEAAREVEESEQEVAAPVKAASDAEIALI